MPTYSIKSSLIGNTGFTSTQIIPETLKFPVDTVIPYYGNDPLLYGWTRYSAADGYCLLGTTASNQIGVKYTVNSGAASAASTTSTDGAHAGTAVTQNVTTTTGGSIGQQGSSGVTHSHTMSGGVSFISNTLINRQNITLLRATISTPYLPTNSLIVKQTAPSNGTAFTATSSTYLVGANNNVSFASGTPVNISGGISFSTSGVHTHASSSTAYKPMATGAYLRNYDMTSGGSHTHSGTISFSQSTIASRLVNLWKLARFTVPETDLIVMYVGSLANLPSSWKLCDGNNGTPNLGGYVIGYANNQWNVITTSNAAGALSIASAYVPHSHTSSYVSTANIAGLTAYHSNYGWSHSHTGSYSLSSYLPPRIGVAFIQYKG